MTLKEKIASIDVDKISDNAKAYIEKVKKVAETDADRAETLIDGLIAKITIDKPDAIKSEQKITKAEAEQKLAKVKQMKKAKVPVLDKVKKDVKKQYPNWDDDRVETLAKIRLQAMEDRQTSIDAMIENLEKTTMYQGKPTSRANIDYVAPKEPNRVMRQRMLGKDAKTGAITEADELRMTGKKFKRKSPTFGKRGGAKRPYYYEYRMNRRDVDSKVMLERGGMLHGDDMNPKDFVLIKAKMRTDSNEDVTFVVAKSELNKIRRSVAGNIREKAKAFVDVYDDMDDLFQYEFVNVITTPKDVKNYIQGHNHTHYSVKPVSGTPEYLGEMGDSIAHYGFTVHKTGHYAKGGSTLDVTWFHVITDKNGKIRLAYLGMGELAKNISKDSFIQIYHPVFDSFDDAVEYMTEEIYPSLSEDVKAYGVKLVDSIEVKLYAKGGATSTDVRVPVDTKVSKEEIDEFIDYVDGFYGKQGIYADDLNGGYTKKEIRNAVMRYLDALDKNRTWGHGDSFDRELVLQYLSDPNNDMDVNDINLFEKGGVIFNEMPKKQGRLTGTSFTSGDNKYTVGKIIGRMNGGEYGEGTDVYEVLGLQNVSSRPMSEKLFNQNVSEGLFKIVEDVRYAKGGAVSTSELNALIAEINEKSGAQFYLGGAYGMYELWAKDKDGGDHRIEVGSRKDIREALIRNRYNEKFTKYAKGGAVGEELMGGQPNTSKPSGYTLVKAKGREIIVTDDGGKTQERWVKNNGYSGYTLHYKGNQYEFVDSFAEGGEVTGHKHVLHIDGQNWFLEKIDSTHFYMSNDRNFRGMAHHIGQHKGEPYYDEVREWLKTTTMAKGGMTMRSIAERYTMNEDENAHSENVVLLAEHFGTPEELKEAKAILKKHNSEGFLSSANGAKRRDLHLKLLKKARAAMAKEGVQFAKGGEVSIPNAEKMFHLPMEMAVYVPSTYDVDKKVSRSEMNARINEVEKYLAETFGGFTSGEKEGGYLSSKNRIVTEKVVPVTAFASKEDFDKKKGQLVNKMAVWAKKWGQEAIGFEFEGDLYYVPQKFKKGGRLTAHYIPQRDIAELKTVFGDTFKGKDLLDGAYAKRKPKSPKMVRQYFEDEAFEFEKGGALSGNAKLLIEYINADVYEDDYEQGEGAYVNGWNHNEAKGTIVKASELVKWLHDNYYLPEDKNAYAVSDGRIFTSMLVDANNDEASDSEKEAWKKGKMKLYTANYSIGVKYVSTTDLDDETLSEMTGIGFYKEGGSVKLAPRAVSRETNAVIDLLKPAEILHKTNSYIKYLDEDGNYHEMSRDSDGVWHKETPESNQPKMTRTMFEEETFEYAKGGKAIGFEKLSDKVAARYAGKSVAPEYQDEYGKRYDRSEAKEVGDKVAGKVYWAQRRKAKMAEGGEVGVGGTMDSSTGNDPMIGGTMASSMFAKGGAIKREENYLLGYEPYFEKHVQIAAINDMTKTVRPTHGYFPNHPLAKKAISWAKRNGYEYVADGKKY